VEREKENKPNTIEMKREELGELNETYL